MNNKILLPELVSRLAKAGGKPKNEIETFLKSFFALITQSLERQETVKIKGFGTFKTNRVEPRKSINVSTGEEMKIPAHYKVVFTPAKSMSDRVNQEFSWLDVIEIDYNLTQEEFNECEAEINTEPSKSGVADTKKELKIKIPEKLNNSAISNDMSKTNDKPGNRNEESKNSSNDNASRQINPRAEAERTNQNARIINSDSDDDQGERLGEEIEKEFGEIEPVEPFGPIDPDDPEPGQPIPEDNAEKVAAEFDPYELTKPAEETPQNQETKYFYISEEDYNNLLKRSDLRTISKHIKKLKKDADEAQARADKRSKHYFIWSIVISFLLVTGCFFLMYGIFLNNKRSYKKEKKAPAKQEEVMTDTLNLVDDEQIGIQVNDNISLAKDTASSQIAKNSDGTNKTKVENGKENNGKENKEEEHEIKAIDKITNTRYLTTMAKEHYGNYNLWPYIYLENESKLGHPDRIKPGTTVEIPDISKYGVDPNNPKDIEKARKLGVEIYKKNNN